MNYKQSLKYLNSFINYEKTPPKSHAELNLERMRYGLEALEHPEHNFFPVLIAGTVGKGSTGFFLEQILIDAKISAGFYHSPHVDDIRERIRVRGKMVSEKKWAGELTLIRKRLAQNPIPSNLGKLTFFEILTLLAIQIFSKEGLRVGIFEIGMGGRLDATNILEAPLCVLTRIDFDHKAFLGNTLAAIAREKAGIIKSAAVVISAPQAAAAMKILKRTAQKSRFMLAKPVSFQPGLAGLFQKQNAGNAAAAAKTLGQYFDFQIKEKNIRRGLKSSNWPARMQILKHKKREIILDAAHNPVGCRELIRGLKQIKKKPDLILFSALKDKESSKMLRILSALKTPLIVSGLKNPRAKTAWKMTAEAKPFFGKIDSAEDVQEAYRFLIEKTEPGTTVVITGSFYLLGEMRRIFK